MSLWFFLLIFAGNLIFPGKKAADSGASQKTALGGGLGAAEAWGTNRNAVADPKAKILNPPMPAFDFCRREPNRRKARAKGPSFCLWQEAKGH
jgi:hypothetical protein